MCVNEVLNVSTIHSLCLELSQNAGSPISPLNKFVLMPHAAALADKTDASLANDGDNISAHWIFPQVMTKEAYSGL